ncbi:UNVERIFIED_CONTAM: Pollen allergen Che a 1 [Sesamum angustifolium]|uniref:Pollen allergen Che a 1 n=1 Tax=Sesamum angustifolium TaxID=2727405 RepID=A0AAW2MSY6_9LAMI
MKMATLPQFAIILAGALCFLSLADVANSQTPEFIVKGMVFCDVCRVNFFNKFSEPMPGGETDDNGIYTFPAEGDHRGELCEVTLVQSSSTECSEIPIDGSGKRPAAEVTLIASSSYLDNIRLAYPLVFTRKETLHKCVEFFKDLQMALARL